MTSVNAPAANGKAKLSLRRSLSLPLVVLYGLGVTIGAGIYVLIGQTAAIAGVHAPIAFVMAAGVMTFTAMSFAELTCRYPVSAGEAAYIRNGLNSRILALVVGLMVVASGSVSAAAITSGSAGYIRVFVELPNEVLIPCVVLAMGGLAAWGILESVTAAAIFTVVEIIGLVIIIFGGFINQPELVWEISKVVPTSFDAPVWVGIGSAGLLAFFAFIGFEDLVNVAEEVKDPQRTLPRAIFLTLIVSTLVYFFVVSIAVLSVAIPDLAASEAPLGLVFQTVTGGPPEILSAIAIVATLNGVIIQMIMASRILYGLANQGQLPGILASVNPVTRTPLIATALVAAIVMFLAMAFPLGGLAETTSRITLTVFALVNLALIRIKWRGDEPPKGGFVAKSWVPPIGLIACVMLLLSDFLG